MLEVELTNDQRQALEGWANEAGREPAALAGGWIAEKLRARVPTPPQPDEAPVSNS